MPRRHSLSQLLKLARSIFTPHFDVHAQLATASPQPAGPPSRAMKVNGDWLPLACFSHDRVLVRLQGIHFSLTVRMSRRTGTQRERRKGQASWIASSRAIGSARATERSMSRIRRKLRRSVRPPSVNWRGVTRSSRPGLIRVRQRHKRLSYRWKSCESPGRRAPRWSVLERARKRHNPLRHCRVNKRSNSGESCRRRHPAPFLCC